MRKRSPARRSSVPSELDAPEADEELRVEGLQQDEVERPEPDLLDELLRARQEHQVADPLDDVEDADDHDHRGERPSVHRLRVAEEDEHRAEAGRRDHDLLQEVEDEVRPVGQLELRLETGEEQDDAEVAPHAPTAV